VGAEVEILGTTNNARTTAINLTGNALNNSIRGNAGANVLTDGLGKDTLIGNAGADRFEFNAVAESGTTSTTRDAIGALSLFFQPGI